MVKGKNHYIKNNFWAGSFLGKFPFFEKKNYLKKKKIFIKKNNWIKNIIKSTDNFKFRIDIIIPRKVNNEKTHCTSMQILLISYVGTSINAYVITLRRLVSTKITP